MKSIVTTTVFVKLFFMYTVAWYSSFYGYLDYFYNDSLKIVEP